MAAVTSTNVKRPFGETGDEDWCNVKRLKVSDLPLSSTKKNAIDGLIHKIKKKGSYDNLRKTVWTLFEEAKEKTAYQESLIRFAETEVDQNTDYLAKDRGKATTLLQGAVERSDLTKPLDLVFEKLIAEHIGVIEAEARQIRSAEVGVEAAAEEERLGRKSDEEYAQEAAKRQEQRAKVRRQEEAKKRREEEMAELKAIEAKKKKELEKLRNAEERRKARAAARAARNESELDRRERANPPKDESLMEKDKEGLGQEEQRDALSTTPITKLDDEKRIEEEALALLLEEGRALASKSEKKEQEPADFREPPHRAAMAIPKGPAADRHKAAYKPEHISSKLSYSSTSVRHHASPNSPVTPAAARNRSQSPHRRGSTHHGYANNPWDKTRPASDHRGYELEEEGPRSGGSHFRESGMRNTDADADKHTQAEYDDPDYSSERQRRDSNASRHFEYDYSRDHRHRHSLEDVSRSRDACHGDRTGSRHDERSTKYGRRPSTRDYVVDKRVKVRTDEPPEHIDRYVPGSGLYRDEGNDRDRDWDSTRDRDSGKEHRDRSSYHDRERTKGRDYSENKRSSHRDRDDDHHDKERYHSKYNNTKYRERDNGKDRGESKYRNREHSTYKGSHTRTAHAEGPRPRRDPAPENIDRYVPS